MFVLNLLLLFFLVSGVVGRDCEAVLGAIPETVKKTKTWKKCQANNEELLKCANSGYDVNELKKKKTDQVLCAYEESDEFTEDFEAHLNEKKQVVIDKYKDTKEFKEIEEDMKKVFLEEYIDTLAEDRIMQTIRDHEQNMAIQRWFAETNISRFTEAVHYLIEEWENKIGLGLNEKWGPPPPPGVGPNGGVGFMSWNPPSSYLTPQFHLTTQTPSTGGFRPQHTVWYGEEEGDLPGRENNVVMAENDGSLGTAYITSLFDMFTALGTVPWDSLAVTVMLMDCGTGQNTNYVGRYETIYIEQLVDMTTIEFSMTLGGFISVGRYEMKNVLQENATYMFMGTEDYPNWYCEPGPEPVGGFYIKFDDRSLPCEGVALMTHLEGGDCTYLWGHDFPVSGLTVVVSDRRDWDLMP